MIMVLVTIIYLFLGIGMTVSGSNEKQEFAGMIFLIATAVLVFVTLVLFIPQIIGGWKLYKLKGNARTWGIVGSITALLSIPFGMAAGIYGLWFLFGDQGKALYSGDHSVGVIPPPPNNWQ